MYMMMPMMINALKNVLDYKVPECKAPKCETFQNVGLQNIGIQNEGFQNARLDNLQTSKMQSTIIHGGSKMHFGSKMQAPKLLVIIQNLDIIHLSSPSSSHLGEKILKLALRSNFICGFIIQLRPKILLMIGKCIINIYHWTFTHQKIK